MEPGGGQEGGGFASGGRIAQHMRVDTFFSDADREAIRAAVAAAETGTSGEIVPFVVAASDEYPNAAWKGAALGALLGALVAAGAYAWGGFWGSWVPLWILVPPAGGAAIGYLATVLSLAIRRWMAGGEMLDLRTRRRAALAFLEQEVFATRDRTGILLFVSLFEHRVVVLGDAGINARVEQREWDSVVRTVIEGVRAGRPGPAIAEAVAECGRLLARHGVARQPDDRDELPDRLRTEDR